MQRCGDVRGAVIPPAKPDRLRLTMFDMLSRRTQPDDRLRLTTLATSYLTFLLPCQFRSPNFGQADTATPAALCVPRLLLASIHSRTERAVSWRWQCAVLLPWALRMGRYFLVFQPSRKLYDIVASGA